MKSFQRIKKIHGRDYLYEITPYYDAKTKKIKQRSKYLGIMKGGKLAESTVRTYSYGDLVSVMKVACDLNLPDLLNEIAPDYADLILVCAINRVLRPESMNNLAIWFEDTYLSAMYDLDLSSQNLSRAMTNVGRMNLNHAYLSRILNKTGKTDALFYDLTSFSLHSRNIEFMEYGYSSSDPDLPQINVSMVQDRKSGMPIFYDLFPGSIVDVKTVLNTIEVLRSAGTSEITLIMDRGMFSSENIEKLLLFNKQERSVKLGFIMPATFTLKEVKRIALQSHRTIERGSNMINIGDEIIFAEQRELSISGNTVKAWIYYQPGRDVIERESFYSALYDRINKLKERKLGDTRSQ